MKRLTVFENTDGTATIEILPDGDNGVSYDFDDWEDAIEALPNIEEI